MSKRQVILRMLPDGSGKVRVHWFKRDPQGQQHTAAGSVQKKFGGKEVGKWEVGGVPGYIACQHDMDLRTKVIRGPVPTADGKTVQVQRGLEPVHFTDDARAATCPECKATPEWQEEMAYLESLVSTGMPGSIPAGV